MKYIYKGDRLTDIRWKNKICIAVKRDTGKCIRGRNGNMLVIFENGDRVNVIARQLRKVNFSIYDLTSA